MQEPNKNSIAFDITVLSYIEDKIAVINAIGERYERANVKLEAAYREFNENALQLRVSQLESEGKFAAEEESITAETSAQLKDGGFFS